MLLSLVKWAIGITITLIGMAIFFPSYPFTFKTRFPSWLASLWARIIVFISGSKVKVIGRENLLKNRSQIFFSNHQSFFDIYILLGYLPLKSIFLSKKVVFKVPLIGWVMKVLGYIPIDRSSPRQALKSLQFASRQLGNGYSIIIFPEGTRSPDGRVQQFKSGSLRLALQSGAAVVPISLFGSGKIQPKGSIKVMGQKVCLVIGQALPPPGNTKEEKAKFLEHIRELIIKNLEIARRAVSPHNS